MNRILIVNVNWRGDVLFSTPFIRAVRRNYPRSFIACLIVPRCAALLENNPHLDELIIFDEQGNHRGLWGKLRLVRQLRAKRFDTAFLLHRSLTRTLVCCLAAITERIGYAHRKREFLLTKKIPLPSRPMHKIDYFLNIAEFGGIKAENRDYELYPAEQDQDYAQSILEKSGLSSKDFLVIINPGGNWALKRWPVERFAGLADRLIEERRAKVILTGAQKDIPLTRAIAGQMRNKPLILAGETTLVQLAALMGRVSLVIANDSGPMHIAVSRNTKTIALFGPTSPEITGPCGKGDYQVLQRAVGCEVPCYQLDCRDNRCMQAITVEDVMEVIKR